MVQYAEVLRSEWGRKSGLKPQALRALMNAARAVASGRWVVSRRLGKSHRRLRWVFQTSRSIRRFDSVSGRITLLVSLADDAENHLFGVDRGDRQRDRLGDPQAIGVDERETAANDGLFQGGDQAAAVLVAADVGKRFWRGLRTFFW